MARTFHVNATYYINLAAGAVSNGAISVAFITRKDGSDTSLQGILPFNNSLGTALGYFGVSTSSKLVWNTGINTRNSTTSWVAADGWMLVGVSRNSGTTTPRFHFYSFANNTWTHENGSGTTANMSSVPNHMRLGRITTSNGFDGTHAVGAVWNRSLGDADFEQLPTSLTGWYAQAPTALWTFDQSDVSQNVVDLTGNGSNQTAIQNTVVADGPPGFSYGDWARVIFASTGGTDGSATAATATSTATAVTAGATGGAGATAATAASVATAYAATATPSVTATADTALSAATAYAASAVGGAGATAGTATSVATATDATATGGAEATADTALSVATAYAATATVSVTATADTALSVAVAYAVTAVPGAEANADTALSAATAHAASATGGASVTADTALSVAGAVVPVATGGATTTAGTALSAATAYAALAVPSVIATADTALSAATAYAVTAGGGGGATADTALSAATAYAATARWATTFRLLPGGTPGLVTTPGGVPTPVVETEASGIPSNTITPGGSGPTVRTGGIPRG